MNMKIESICLSMYDSRVMKTGEAHRRENHTSSYLEFSFGTFSHLDCDPINHFISHELFTFASSI